MRETQRGPCSLRALFQSALNLGQSLKLLLDHPQLDETDRNGGALIHQPQRLVRPVDNLEQTQNMSRGYRTILLQGSSKADTLGIVSLATLLIPTIPNAADSSIAVISNPCTDWCQSTESSASCLQQASSTAINIPGMRLLQISYDSSSNQIIVRRKVAPLS